MRNWQRNLLLMGLSAVSGAADSWSYFGLGHIFIANMTGNTVLLGYSAATGDWVRAAGAFGAIGSYAAGVFAGSLLSEPIREAVRAAAEHAVLWPRRVTVILAVELCLLLTAGAADAWAHAGGLPGHTPISFPKQAPHLLPHVLVCVSAFAIGLQSAAMVALKLQAVVTTYITGTWTSLVSGIAAFVESHLGSNLRRDAKRSPDKTTANRAAAWQIATQAMVVATYCCAAALAGAAMRFIGQSAVAMLPGILLVLVVAAALILGREAQR